MNMYNIPCLHIVKYVDKDNITYSVGLLLCSFFNPGHCAGLKEWKEQEVRHHAFFLIAIPIKASVSEIKRIARNMAYTFKQRFHWRKFLLSLLMVLSLFNGNAQQTPIPTNNSDGSISVFSMEQKLERFIVKKNLPNSVENATYTIYLQRGEKLVFDFNDNTVNVTGFTYTLKDIVYTPIKCIIYLTNNSDVQNPQDPEEIILSKSTVVLKYSDSHKREYKYETIS